MQDRPEHLAIEPRRTVDLERARREEAAVLGPGRQATLIQQAPLPRHPLGVTLQGLARGRVDDRADIGREQPRIADPQLGHRARQHRQDPLGDVLLHVEQAQRRAALPGAVEGRGERRRATTCSGSAEESTIIAFWPPVSAISGTIGPSRCASARLIARAVSVEPVKATPATRGSATSAAPTLAPVAGQELQHIRRDAGRHAAAAPPRRRSAASARPAWR